MRAARVRTESMAQRLSKKPISEGFELWDRGYNLGAMRLFIFKAETSPPFQLGPCLDAVGHLLLALDEYADAKENFGYAAEKYELIQQPILAQVMKFKGVEAVEGPGAAREQLSSYLAATDPHRGGASLTDARTKGNLARAWAYHAELLLKENPEAFAAQAIADAEYAASIGWDRAFLAVFSVGQAKQQLGDDAGALHAYEQCLQMNQNYLPAYEAGAQAAKRLGNRDRALQLLDSAIAIHPRSSLIRERAFTISEGGNDTEALRYLDEQIANPQPEETEAINFGSGATVATLLKAKAAILADCGKMAEAQAAAQRALELNPGDEEAQSILADIQTSAAEQ